MSASTHFTSQSRSAVVHNRAARPKTAPRCCQDAVRDGRLTMGHAKVLLGIPDATTCKAIARRCSKEQWSVRELERQLKKRAAKGGTQPKELEPREMFLQNLGEQLTEHLGTQVAITSGKKKGTGKISISFYSNEQFEGLLDSLQFKPTS